MLAPEGTALQWLDLAGVAERLRSRALDHRHLRN
jgi:hypothetical protein